MNLKRLRALCDAATSGPWVVVHDGVEVHCIHVEGDHLDQVVQCDAGAYPPDLPTALFIVAARSAVPELLDEVERLNRELTEQRCVGQLALLLGLTANRELVEVRMRLAATQAERDGVAATCQRYVQHHALALDMVEKVEAELNESRELNASLHNIMKAAHEINTQRIATLRLEVDRLKLIDVEVCSALDESVKLQSHYAALLNMYDDGRRRVFATALEFIERLREMQRS